MKDYYFERWIANDAMRKFNTRAATILIDGVDVCGVVRDEGVGTVYVSLTKPYRPENARIMFGGPPWPEKH